MGKKASKEQIPVFNLDSEFVKGEVLSKSICRDKTIFSGLNKNTGSLVAISQIKAKNKKSRDQLNSNLGLISKACHPNLLKYIGINGDNSESTDIIMEYCNGGSIKHLLDKFNTFEEGLIKNYLKQLLEAISYLHRNRIPNRSIRNTNILLDDDKVKLSFFDIDKYTKNENIHSFPKDESLKDNPSNIK
jgi:serine/threonine protein kinase